MHDIKGKLNTLKLTGLPIDRRCSYNNVDFDMTGERGTVLIHVLSLCKITVGMNYRAV